MFFPSFMGLS